MKKRTSFSSPFNVSPPPPVPRQLLMWSRTYKAGFLIGFSSLATDKGVHGAWCLRKYFLTYVSTNHRVLGSISGHICQQSTMTASREDLQSLVETQTEQRRTQLSTGHSAKFRACGEARCGFQRLWLLRSQHCEHEGRRDGPGEQKLTLVTYSRMRNGLMRIQFSIWWLLCWGIMTALVC